MMNIGPRNIMKPSVFAALGLIIFTLDFSSVFAESPYPPSNFITGVTWDWSTRDTLAPGSDNWPITWADDNNQYTCWGDGGGFGGTNSLGRVSLGFARVEGDWNNYQGKNIWGGYNSENPAGFGGKSYGIICINGVLFAWLGQDGSNSGSEKFVKQTMLIKSVDHGATWVKSNWFWTDNDNLYGPSFLNFGKNYTGARDDYVYSYFPRGSTWMLHKPGMADLARVPRNEIMSQKAYEWFAGFDDSGNPAWTSNLDARQPVFEDPNGVRTVSVCYNPGLKRYILTSQHTKVGREPGTNQWGIFEAEEPWGPWQTVYYTTNWAGGIGNISFYFAPKWFSADGRDFALIYTANDHWGAVRGHFTLKNSNNTQP